MDGILIINKEKGCTSHDVVYKVKKLLNKKIGHTGTLDPNATGVLPILIGKGTELSQFLINHDKKYIATIKLGEKTDTADIEGNIIEKKEIPAQALDEKNVRRVLQELVGKQIQTPPMYSAIKVNGKKLYEYARKGQEVEVPKREIEIYELNLLNIEQDKIIFEIYCSKGTYVRSVCEKIAEELNTVGYMLDLQRTMVGDFFIENAITISELEENFNNEDYMFNKIISIEKFFEKSPRVELDEKKLKLFLNGVCLSTDCLDGIVNIYNNEGKFVGIGICEKGKLKRKIVLE